MVKMPSIAISGELGSGKSTVAKLVAQRLLYEYMSTGKVQRQLAAQMGMTTLELNRHSDSDAGIDQQIDSVFKTDLSLKQQHIIDSRLAWHFVAGAYRVHLVVDLKVAAGRVVADTGRASEAYESVDDAMAALSARAQSERERFRRVYGVDCSDIKNYDLVIDSSVATASDVTEAIVAAYRTAQAGEHFGHVFVSPLSLLPTEGLNSVSGMAAGAVLSSVRAIGLDARNPVEVFRFGRHRYIIDGHRRVSAALVLGLPFVPVRETCVDTLDDVFDVCGGKRLISAWEDFHSVKLQD